MPRQSVTFIKGDKIGSETDYRDALPVNMYAVEKNILGAQGYMICYPGLTLHGTGAGIDRGGNYNDRFSTQFRVSGNSLIELDSSGISTTLGVISGTEQVAMPYSFNTQCVIADGKMFLYDSVNGFQKVTDSDLGNPIDGVWIDGYYFLTDGEYIYHTDIDDETSIDPLKFATAEFMPDPTLGVSKTQDNKVVVWGRYSVEYFIDAEQDNFAFRRIETRTQKIGIVATHAKTELNGKFYIAGGRKNEAVFIYMVDVGGSQKISTREIDKILKEYTEPELSDMRMESRIEDNMAFVLIHLPNETLCFNESIAKSFGVEIAWSILKTDVVGSNPYRGINGVFDPRISKWIYGDRRSNKIGKLDNGVCTHYGEMVEWLLYSPLLKLETFSIDELEIETIPGHTTSQDAKIGVSITYDGLTYGTEVFEMYGTPSNYDRRFILRTLGYVRDWLGFKFRGATTSRMALSLLEITYS